MRKIVNPTWIAHVQKAIIERRKIDETISFNLSAQWLITSLSEQDIPFKMYNLGAGVKRITTETDICPCCKKKL